MKESIAWKVLTQHFETEQSLMSRSGICSAIKEVTRFERNGVSEYRMRKRLDLLNPGDRSEYGYWWEVPWSAPEAWDERAMACALLATLAEEDETLGEYQTWR